MFNISKKMINEKIVPYLSKGKRGPSCKVKLWRIVRAIIYRLKTGVQWRSLPIATLFGSSGAISWKTVHYYFSKWSKDESWERLWTFSLKGHTGFLDMSQVEFDGSHTVAKNGGEAVAYQKRKRAKTSNLLFLVDRQGIPLACGPVMAGNHHDMFEIQKSMSKIEKTLSKAQLSLDGLFLNADAGFDGKKMRDYCEQKGIFANIDENPRNQKGDFESSYVFDNELYKGRFVVERTNAWLDGFKSLIMRYETKARNWLALHYLAFTVVLLRKAGLFN